MRGDDAMPGFPVTFLTMASQRACAMSRVSSAVPRRPQVNLLLDVVEATVTLTEIPSDP